MRLSIFWKKQALILTSYNNVKAKEECELAFKNDFLYKIRTSINETYENINNLNKILKREENRFGKDKEIYE